MSYAYDRARKSLLNSKPEMSCHYCHVQVEPSSKRFRVNSLTFDHVIPLSSGGKNVPSNLVICCMGCNSLKGSMTCEEYSSQVKNVCDRDNLILQKKKKRVSSKEERNNMMVVKMATLFSFFNLNLNTYLDFV